MYAEVTKFGWTLTVDLHGLTVEEAKAQLNEIIRDCDNTIKEIEVIHGYSRGNKLQGYVRSQLKHKRVIGKELGLNQGITILKIAKR